MSEALIGLEEVKLHCRIDGNNEDALIEAYIIAALAACQKHIGRKFGDDLEFTPDIKVGCLMLISHMYENREPVNIGNITSEIPFTTSYLWNAYRYPGVY